MGSDFRIAANTNALRKAMDPADIGRMLSRIELDGVEWGLPALKEAPAFVKEALAVADGEGLDVCGFVNAGALWKTGLMREWSEALAPAAPTSVRVGPPWVAYNFDESLHQPDTYPELIAKTRAGLEALLPLAREYGIRYLVEMHHGNVAASAPVCRELAEGLDPAAVGFIYDPANGIHEGFLRPRHVVELLGEHLAYVHAKNLVMEPTGDAEPAEAVPRRAWGSRVTKLHEGVVDWVEVLFALKDAGWSGWISMEEFFAVDPEPALDEGYRFLLDCARHAPAGRQPPYTTFND